ncbi:MAG: hypothetical protein ACI4EQ_07310 [Lachnospiraceae bacterium]
MGKRKSILTRLWVTGRSFFRYIVIEFLWICSIIEQESTQDNTGVGLRERVLYDALRDMNNPWFHSGAGIVDFEEATPITEKQANSIIDSYEYEKLVFTPFCDGATF